MTKLPDVTTIIRWLAEHHEEDLTIVGGQALALWEEFLGLESSVQTKDIDLLGGSEHAAELAMLINGQYKIASLDDQTINNAIIYKDGEEIVDFIDFVKGVDEDALFKRRIKIRPSFGGILYLQHPVDCLRGKIANYFEIPGKRNQKGLDQITSAIKVCKSYCELLISESREKDAIEIANVVMSLAMKDRIKRLFHIQNIDVMNAIPPMGRFKTMLFREENYPRQLKIINERRVRYLKHLQKHGVI